jgi:tetratricopeptide (TPR) repeat protein
MDQEVQNHFTRAQAFIDARNYDYALEEYRKIFSIKSDCLEAHQSYVDCMYEYTDKNLKEAFTFYKKQIKKDKNTTPVWYLGLGYCYKKIGNNTMALDNCQKACDLLSGITEKKEVYEKYYKFAKEDHGIPVVRRVIPLIYKVSIVSIILFIITFFVIRYYLRKKILEKIIKLEGTFEVFDPRGFKRYMLDCTDKKLFQKYGDTIRVGSKKGCDIQLKIKDEEKVYAILEAEKIEEQNRITIRTGSDDIEMFLEVPKSRYTPDDMVKLPFKGSPLWDNDIINIKDYRIFYHNVKLGKRLWKDYPESAKGFLFVDPATPQEIELPDMALLKSKLVPEEEQVYNPYQDISKTVKTIISSVEYENEEEEGKYDFEPMDEKYIMEILPPSGKEENSDLLTYKTEEEEDYYDEEDITLPEHVNDKTDDILVYPVENPVDDNEEVYEFKETLLPEIVKSEELLTYPSDEEGEYEIDVLAPVETGKKHGADVLTYITEEDLKDEEYEFETIIPGETNKSNDLLSYPVPTEEEDDMLDYAETEENSQEEQEEAEKKVTEAESMELLEHYPTHLQKIDTDSELPYEEQKNSDSMDFTGLELSPPGEVFCGIQGMEISEEKKDGDISDISLEFSTPVQVKNSMENTGVSIDFSIFEENKQGDNIQVSSLFIDYTAPEENNIMISDIKSWEEKKVKKKIKQKEDNSDQEVKVKKKIKQKEDNSDQEVKVKKVKKKKIKQENGEVN